MRADNYRGAEAVLGWSFYSQGTKERATSADAFLDWALEKLGVKSAANSAVVKGEAIAEAIMRRRALLVLDGVEPLQHGPDGQLGQLKDPGLRALLRRFAATPPIEPHGLIVLTSRLAVADIARWKDGAAPVVDVEKLSDEAGAALLRDNGVWGTDKQLKDAAHDFGGHPLALGLLASFLKETQFGDVRRRDHIRAYLADTDNPRHDHAQRVMESYEKEWLARQPVLRAIMNMVGLFDRPASGECLAALRAEPAIPGFTEAIVGVDEIAWRRAVARLREVRLLAPPDPAAPEALDAHPLVREWFGERQRQANEAAWKVAHGRLYEHLRDTTKEGETPTLSDLAPLYQAIAHGCRAGRHQEALDRISTGTGSAAAEGRWWDRILFATTSSAPSAATWRRSPGSSTSPSRCRFRRSVRQIKLGCSASRRFRCARGVGSPRHCRPLRAGSESMEVVGGRDWRNAAIATSNLSESELLVGAVAAAFANAQQSIDYADRSGDDFQMIGKRTTHADALLAAGRRDEATRWFADAEQRQQTRQPDYPLLYSVQGYRYCDLLLPNGDPTAAYDRATRTLAWVTSQNWLLDIALDTLTLARAGLALVH